MRNFLIRILQALLLLAVASSFAHAEGQFVYFKKKAAAGGGAPTLLVDEGFEGAGAPASWTSAGTVDWDEATVFHDGAQSLQVDSGSADGYGAITFAGANDIYGEYWFYNDHIPSTDAIVLRLYNGATELAKIEQRASGVLRAQAIGGTTGACTLTTGEDSWKRIWFHFTIGGGADATMRVWWATDDTHPGNGSAQYFCQSTNGTTTLQATAVRLFSDNIGTTNGSRYYDTLVVDDAILW